MTTETGVTAGGEAIFSTELPADAPESFNSPREAAEYFTSLKEKKPTAESAEPATAEHELSVEDNADPLEAAPGEDDDADPASKEPLIDRPKSWTDAEDAEWRATPRALQQKIVARELERDTALRRTQNDAAEKLKGLTVREQQADQARQQYEAKISSTVKIMEDALQADFGDIQSLHDVRNLQANDPFRFQAWQVRQMELTAAKTEEAAALQRQSQEKLSKRAAYEAEQNQTLIELVPDMADPKKASELRESAVKMLTESLGLKIDQLQRWMQDDTGHEILSSAGIQKLIADGLAFQALKSAPKAVATKSVPPVQRPGTSRPSGQGVDSERLQALNRKPELTVKEATELVTLQQRSQRRAS